MHFNINQAALCNKGQPDFDELLNRLKDYIEKL
ncbi:hypothetical protein MMC2321_02739 [Chitinophaga sp. MM2321]